MQFINLAFLGLAASTPVAASVLPRSSMGSWTVTKVNQPTANRFDQVYTMHVNFTSDSYPAGNPITCTMSFETPGSAPQQNCDDWRFNYTYDPESNFLTMNELVTFPFAERLYGSGELTVTTQPDGSSTEVGTIEVTSAIPEAA